MDNNYHKVPISVNLLLIKNNALLLGLRNKVKQDQGLWGFVAGHLEEGESIISAMIREAKEELGIKIKNSDLKLVSVIHGLKPAYVGFFLECRKWEGKIENMEPDKCQKLEFFNLDNLPEEKIIPYVKKAIDCFQNKIIFDEIL